MLNVNTLRKGGWKISHICSLPADELEALVWESARSAKTTGQVYDIYMQALISASLAFDEAWFDSVYQEVTTRFGLPDSMHHVIGPFFERVGLMWTVMKLHPGQEHFASNLVRRKILSEIDRLPAPSKNMMYLLFLPPWEEHEIGLIYGWYLLRAAGYSVIYLGQRVPIKALLQTVGVVKPNALLTFFVTEQATHLLQDYADALSVQSGDRPVYSGHRNGVLSEITIPTHLKVLNSPQDLLDIL